MRLVLLLLLVISGCWFIHCWLGGGTNRWLGLLFDQLTTVQSQLCKGCDSGISCDQAEVDQSGFLKHLQELERSGSSMRLECSRLQNLVKEHQLAFNQVMTLRWAFLCRLMFVLLLSECMKRFVPWHELDSGSINITPLIRLGVSSSIPYGHLAAGSLILVLCSMEWLIPSIFRSRPNLATHLQRIVAESSWRLGEAPGMITRLQDGFPLLELFGFGSILGLKMIDQWVVASGMAL